MARWSTIHNAQHGFTIVETMVALVLLLVGMAATLTVLTQAGATTVKTRTREQATNLQRELVEAARSVPYDQLTPNGLGAAVRARPALGDSSVGAAGWTVRRRNASYTVSMGVCTVDDPRDGTGPHEAGVFCAAAGPPPTPAQCANLINASVLGALPGAGAGADLSLGQCGLDANLDGTVDGLVSASATVCLALLSPCSTPPDTNPADYKRIVSLVRWTGGGYNLQTSQVNNPGLAAAPAVTSLTAQTNTITDTRSSLGLTSTTTNTPSTVALYLDGTAIGTAASTGGANWAATWNLGPVTTTVGEQPPSSETVDGSYELSEKAFDQYGQYGATRSQTIVVNRRQHFAPARIAVGRNGSEVEVEWSPAKERDSEGFRVDRKVNGGPWVEVSPRAVRTTWRDDNAPAGTLLAPLSYTYSVVGYDRDPVTDQLRAGDRSVAKVVDDPAPLTPGTPGSLQASLVDGNVVLTWAAPPPDLLRPAPDHYNIYRVVQGAGGPGYADRLDSAYFESGQPLSYTDTRTTGLIHDYWITAVNSQLGESAKLGPVRR